MADSQKNETVTTPEGEQQQTQLRMDDSGCNVHYSSTASIRSTAEEVFIDFSQGVRPSGQANVAVLKIDDRVIMSPWAAKRLAMALGQTIQRYENTYGPIETDPRKRLTDKAKQAQQAQSSSTTTST